LLLWRFTPPLAPPTPTETSKTHIFDITRAAAAEAIVRGTTPLLCFADFTDRMSPPNGHFELARARDSEIFAAKAIFSATFGRLPETFAIASTFLFFRRRNGHWTRSIAHPREFEYTVQATIICNAGETGFVLCARVTVHNISSLLFHPRKESNIILFTLVTQGKVWQRDLEPRNRSKINLHMLKVDTSRQRSNPTGQKLFHSILTSNILRGTDESIVIQVMSSVRGNRLRAEIQSAHV
jgi:hypothetical protein